MYVIYSSWRWETDSQRHVIPRLQHQDVPCRYELASRYIMPEEPQMQYFHTFNYYGFNPVIKWCICMFRKKFGGPVRKSCNKNIFNTPALSWLKGLWTPILLFFLSNSWQNINCFWNSSCFQILFALWLWDTAVWGKSHKFIGIHETSYMVLWALDMISKGETQCVVSLWHKRERISA